MNIMQVHDGCFNFSRRRIDLFQYINSLHPGKAGSCKQPLILPEGSFPLVAKPTRKLAARTFIQSQYLKALAVSLAFAMSGKEA